MEALGELFKWLKKTRGGNGIVIKAAEELATLRAERDEAARLLEEAFTEFEFKGSGTTALGRAIVSWRGRVFDFLTRKVKL